jgi:protein-tyrosine phosphatase
MLSEYSQETAKRQRFKEISGRDGAEMDRKNHIREDMGIRHTVNFRGLGGYAADGGRVIKRGIFYRGGEMESVGTDPEDRETLKSLGIRTILDLRSKGEALASPDSVPEGTDYIRLCAMHFPDGSDLDFSPQGMQKTKRRMEEVMAMLPASDELKKGLTLFYTLMPFGNPAFQELFRILEEGRVPVLFHCTAGKDRTGVAAMLIMLALGCSREDAVYDYMLTNECRREIIEEAVRSRKSRDPGISEEIIRQMYGVSRVNAECTLDAILERYGTFETYFEKEFGLGRERLKALRDTYLEEPSD